MIWLNIAIAFFGLLATLAAFGGDTWEKGKAPVLSRITPRGWLSLACIVLAFSLGIIKELKQDKISKDSAAKREELEEESRQKQGRIERLSETNLSLTQRISDKTQELEVLGKSNRSLNQKIAEQNLEIKDLSEANLALSKRISEQSSDLKGMSQQILDILAPDNLSATLNKGASETGFDRPTSIKILFSPEAFLTWNDNSDNEDGFSIERSINGQDFHNITTVGQNVASYSDDNIVENQMYYYRVRAYNNSGNSGYSNIATFIYKSTEAELNI